MLCRAQFGYGADAGDDNEDLAAGREIRQVVNGEAEDLGIGSEDSNMYGLGYAPEVGKAAEHQDKKQHLRTRFPRPY